MQLVADSYWTRAWTTQESLLARRLTFTTDTATISVSRLFTLRHLQYNWNSGINLNYKGTVVKVFANMYHLAVAALGEDRQSLVSLLDHSPDRNSRDPLDRVYSLRYLASDAKNIKVDYGGGDQDFFEQIISCCR